MDKTVAVTSMIVKDADKLDSVNHVLENYESDIIGRMGVFKGDGRHVVSVAICAENSVIGELEKSIDQIGNVSVKTVYENLG